ncbi:hypothetical protein SLS61_008829 [Didymella pomorum]
MSGRTRSSRSNATDTNISEPPPAKNRKVSVDDKMTDNVQQTASSKEHEERIENIYQEVVRIWTKANVAERRLEWAKKGARSQKDKTQLSFQEHCKKELVSTAKIVELELKPVKFENENGTGRDKRKAEAVIRLSNAFHDLLEKADKDKLEADGTSAEESDG